MMRFLSVYLHAVLMATMGLLALSFGTALAQTVALVTDVTGKVNVQGGRAINIMSEIPLNVRIQLDAGAQVIVLYTQSGDEYALSGSATIEFRADAPVATSGTGPRKLASSLARGGKDVTIKLSGVSQAGFVMRGSRNTGRIRLLSLANTTTMERALEFRWQRSNTNSRHQFRLMDESGKVLHEALVEGVSLRLPSSVSLASGQRYFWEISASFDDGKRYVSTADFVLASQELTSEVEALRPAPNASVAERVLFAVWLERAELRDEARRYWSNLLSERPDDPTLRMLVEDSVAAPRTVSDITTLLEQYKPDQTKVDELKKIVNSAPPAGASPDALLRFYVERAYAAQELGMVVNQITDLRLVLTFTKRMEDEWTITQDLFLAERLAGNFANAVRLKEQMLRLTVKADGRQLTDHVNTVELYSSMGDFEAARRSLRSAEAVYLILSGRRQAWMRAGDNFTRQIEKARGEVLQMQGKLVEAEVAFRKELAASERWVVLADQRTPGGTIAPPQERRENNVDGAEVRLANNLRMQGRLVEAELSLRNVLQRRLSRLGRYAPTTAAAVGQFARLLNEQGRFGDAEAMAREAIAIHQTVGSAPASFAYIAARRELAAAMVMQARWADGLAVYEEIRAIVPDDDLLNRVGRGPNRALALIKTGRATDAMPALESELKAISERLGAGHYEVAERRGFLAMALAESGQQQRALIEFQEATKVLLSGGSSFTSEDGVPPIRVRRLTLILESFIKLLYEIRNESGLRAGFDPTFESFRIADAMRGQGAQSALVASAARAASGNAELALLVRNEQDGRQLVSVMYATLLRLLSAPADQQLSQVAAQMRTRIQEIEKEQRQRTVDLERRFPAYTNLINPRPATIEETRIALRNGEVLLSVLTTTDRTYVWVVPKSGAVAFHAVTLGDKAVAGVVASLRKALDVGRITLDAVPDFDVVSAHRLYAELLKPVEEAWKGAHTLMVVANGALAQIPFSILPTDPVILANEQGQRFSRYKSVPWLIKQIAVSQLPAVNTLTMLRRLPPGNDSRTSFAGFGDPQFGPQTLSETQPSGLTLRMRSAAQRESKSDNWAPYGLLAPLPDTREEILAMAVALKADVQRDVFLGASASKQNVGAAGLSTRRIVAFATHGLIPGDFPNLDQPALALSALGGSSDEGLLTLGDIMAMKLDADWVVLSACNTAAGDGQGAEAISGLGRGFFYAGSRALLVTHWGVETRSARDLVTAVFERYTTQPSSRAEALRQASITVMESSASAVGGMPTFSYAHPLFWAPYALIGDGGR